jgi:hypothetical protein
LEERVEIVGQFGAGPILRPDDFAIETAIAADDIGFGVHAGAVIFGELSFSWVAIRGETDAVRLQEFFVGRLVFVHAHADYSAPERFDAALKGVERRGFIHARWTPRGPEIHQHNFAAKIGQMRGLAVAGKLKILGGSPAKAGLALPVIRVSEKDEQAHEEGENESRFQFSYQSFVQANYNTSFLG